MNKSELIHQSQHGSKNAFEILLKAYLKSMYAVAFSIMHHHHDAQDVVNESLLIIWLKIKDYRGGSFDSWVYRIVRRVALGIRRRERAQKRTMPELNCETSVGSVCSADAYLEARETHIAAKKAYEHLKPIQKELLRLSRAGLSIAQMAEHRGLAEGTIKSHISRARGEIKKAISH